MLRLLMDTAVGFIIIIRKNAIAIYKVISDQ